MATHVRQVATGPDAPPWRLTDGLNAKLASLRAMGFEVQHVEAGRAYLTRLLIEGGDEAIRLDADPGVDRAWYGDVEIRHSAEREETWVFVTGEVAAGDVSAEFTPACGACQ